MLRRITADARTGAVFRLTFDLYLSGATAPTATAAAKLADIRWLATVTADALIMYCGPDSDMDARSALADLAVAANRPAGQVPARWTSLVLDTLTECPESDFVHAPGVSRPDDALEAEMVAEILARRPPC